MKKRGWASWMIGACVFVATLGCGSVGGAAPSSRPVRASSNNKVSLRSGTPEWRKVTRNEIRKRLQQYLNTKHLSACTSFTEWSLLVYPNAKRSASLIMKELTPHLKTALSAPQKKKLLKSIRTHVMGAIVRTDILSKRQHNLGVIKLKGRYWDDTTGVRHPLLIFRGSFTPAPTKPGSCIQFLLNQANVRHLVSLYDGDLLDVDDLRQQEKQAASKAQASYVETRDFNKRYGHWRHALQQKATFNNPKALRKVMKQVAMLIQEQILKPGGKAPQGNVFFHCGGGMHRSGVLAGVLRRCINREDMKKITRLHKYHSAYTSAKKTGGYEPLLVRFIREFDCSLLK
ncbi:MAG: hypothetical protein EP343_32935 [Deltaproteobacteria bacterium]|nr:MAG: hypothetical protein EP343_32935 [Deltaproteobacteria bacterium]